LPGGNPRPSRCGDRDGWFGYLGTVTVAVILTAATIALPASLRCKAAYLLCGAVKAEAGAVIKVTEGAGAPDESASGIVHQGGDVGLARAARRLTIRKNPAEIGRSECNEIARSDVTFSA
jgi:hypothetical protein